MCKYLENGLKPILEKCVFRQNPERSYPIHVAEVQEGQTPYSEWPGWPGLVAAKDSVFKMSHSEENLI